MNAPRSLRFIDLFFYAAAMALSIRWISIAAAAGPASMPIWLLAVVLFSGPLTVATAELTTRFAGEGGVYAWTGMTFGPFWGFLCGWLYWACNLPFFAGVLVFLVTLLAATLGPTGHAWLSSPALVMGVSIALALAVGVLHLLGLGSGKWLSNVGAASNFVLVGLVVWVGVALWRQQGPATDFSHASYALPLNADGAILWATMVFGIGGCEGLAFLRNEVRGGIPTILRVLATVAFFQILFYVAGTGAMLSILTPQAATRLSGLPDAIVLGMDQLGLGRLAPLPLLVAALCTLGSYSAWFSVAARLPFAAGIDAYLPPAFGHRHPRTGAPLVAIAVQTAIVVVIVIFSQAGDTLRGAYDFLVAMSVLSYTFPFVFLFLVFLRLQASPDARTPGDWRTPGGAPVAVAIGTVGLASTLLAVACTLVPSPESADPVHEIVKLVFASALLIAAGIACYLLARRRAHPHGAIEVDSSAARTQAPSQ